MPKSEADRIAAERAAIQHQEDQRARDREDGRQVDELDALRERADRAFPVFLEKRKVQNYLGIEQVEAYVPCTGLARLFGKSRLAKLGGYPTRIKFSIGEHFPQTVYVLSNKRFMVGSGSHSPREFASMIERRQGTEVFTIENFRVLVNYLEN